MVEAVAPLCSSSSSQTLIPRTFGCASTAVELLGFGQKWYEYESAPPWLASSQHFEQQSATRIYHVHALVSPVSTVLREIKDALWLRGEDSV